MRGLPWDQGHRCGSMGAIRHTRVNRAGPCQPWNLCTAVPLDQTPFSLISAPMSLAQ